MGARRGGGPTLRARIAALFAASFGAGDVWLDADSFTQSAGNVTALVDRRDPTHAPALQGTPVVVPAANASFLGRNTLAVAGATYFDSNRVKSAFRGLHGDALGGSYLHVYRLTSTAGFHGLHATTTTPNTVGSVCYGTDGTNYNHQTWNAGANVALRVGGTPDASPLTLSGVVSPTRAELYRKSTMIQGGAPSGVPAAGVDPSIALRLFAVGGAFALASLEWRASYFWMRALSAQELRIARLYAQYDCGVSAV